MGNWWEDVDLDDDFVQAASVRERSAEERVAELRRVALERRSLDEARAAAWAEEIWADEVAETRRRRRRRRVRITAWLLLAALAIGGFLRLRSAMVTSNAIGLGRVRAPITWSGGETPSPPTDIASAPLGTPPDLDGAPSGSFGFVGVQADGRTPVAYDPCRPIHYVVNHRTEPEGAEDLVAEAIAEVSNATGLVFVADGPTEERPVLGRAAFQPDEYGDRWAPVLIAWTEENEVPELSGNVAGSAGSVQLRTSSMNGPERRLYVTGAVHLDGVDLAETIDSDAGTAGVRAVIMHELGHLVGLDHVDDPRQLMFPTAGRTTTFAAGDRQGLAELGKGECHPDL